MRTSVLAVTAFLSGVVLTILLGSHGLVRPASAQFENPGSVPTVPPLGAAVPKVVPLSQSVVYSQHNTVISGPWSPPTRIMLDGMNVDGNVYVNPKGTIFVYGGGAYHLGINSIGGPVSLELTGAAANTAELLAQFGFLVGEPKPVTSLAPPRKKNEPIVKKPVIPRPLKGDIGSRYDRYEAEEPPK